jgi:hypothetical protein
MTDLVLRGGRVDCATRKRYVGRARGRRRATRRLGIAELIDGREDTNGRSPPTRPVVGAAVDVGLGEGFRMPVRCGGDGRIAPDSGHSREPLDPWGSTDNNPSSLALELGLHPIFIHWPASFKTIESVPPRIPKTAPVDCNGRDSSNPRCNRPSLIYIFICIFICIYIGS